MGVNWAMSQLENVERALEKAARENDQLSDDERKAIREVLEWWHMWKAWGKLGKVVLWAIITCGAVAAAARETGIFTWLRG